MKKDWTNTVALLAKAAKLKPMARVRIELLWREKNQRRDPDNIAASAKVVLDGLQLAGVLANDGWKEIAGWSNAFEVSDRPGVLVTMIECQPDDSLA